MNSLTYIFVFLLLHQVRRGTVALLPESGVVGQVEVVDRGGSLLVVWEVLGERHTVIKAAPTLGWQTSFVIKPAMFSPAALMWETVAQVSYWNTLS